MNHSFRNVRGTKDLSPDDCRRYLALSKIMTNVVSCYGFVPIDTPILEFTDIFFNRPSPISLYWYSSL